MILEAMIILFGLFGLGVVGGLEKGLLGIGTAVVLWVLTAAAIAILVSIRNTVKGEKMANKRTQNDMILEHLKRHGSIERFQARGLYRCERLASRINDLRRQGHPIRTEMRYKLSEDGETVKWAEYVYTPEGE